MTITVSVYQKDGLCRGPKIGNAIFYARLGIILVSLPATGGGPLSGSEHVYTVAPPAGLSSWDLSVESPIHQALFFFVRDGSTHEVWLARRP